MLEAQSIQFRLSEVPEFSLHLIHHSNDLISKAQGSIGSVLEIMLRGERPQKVPFGLNLQNVTRSQWIPLDFSRGTGVKCGKKPCQRAARSARFRVDGREISRSTPQVQKLHEPSAMFPI